MKRIFSIIIGSLVLYVLPVQAQVIYLPEIHCKHFFHGYPSGTPLTNDLIIRENYALSNNDTTKFADWVAYRLDKSTVEGESNSRRNWKADPWLDDDETLEPKDYHDASAALGIDRGHQAPLASFKGTDSAAETNYLSNITPQKKNLNQGVWVKLEGKIRNLVSNSEQPVYVMTGVINGNNTMRLPDADEPHIIPSAYWKIVAIQENKNDLSTIKTASFIFAQDTPRRAKLFDHVVTINDIEKQTNLDFLRVLDNSLEEKLESTTHLEWVKRNFE